MKLFIIINLIIYSLSLFGQGKCFENCWTNFEKATSNIDFRNDTIDINGQITNNLLGCNIPNFNVETINGKLLSSSELKGKVIVLNFWFIGCAPCVAEIPALNKLAEEYKDSNVVFIAFSIDGTRPIKWFVEDNQSFNYNLVSSKYDMTKIFCIIGGYPTNMVFDKKGILQQIFSGGKIDERAKIEAYNKMKPTIDKCLNSN